MKVVYPLYTMYDWSRNFSCRSTLILFFPSRALISIVIGDAAYLIEQQVDEYDNPDTFLTLD